MLHAHRFCHICFALNFIAGGLVDRAIAMPVVRPTVPLTGTTHSDLWSGFFDVPAVSDFTALVHDGLCGADTGIVHFDTDGAFGNIKMLVRYFLSLPGDVGGHHHAMLTHHPWPMSCSV